MPKFYGRDYFSYRILQREDKQSRLILKHPPGSSEKFNWKNIKLNYEAYRNPWEFILSNTKDISDEELPDIDVYFLAYLKQESPDFVLSCSDVVDGIYVENITTETIETPLVTNLAALSDSGHILDHFNELESMLQQEEEPSKNEKNIIELGREVVDDTPFLHSFSTDVLMEPPLLTYHTSIGEIDLKFNSVNKVDEIFKEIPLQAISHPIKKISLQEHLISSRKSLNILEKNKSVIEKPILNFHQNDNKDTPFVINNLKLVDIIEEPIDLTKWNLNVCEKSPFKQHEYLLTPPNIHLSALSGDSYDYLTHVCPVVTDVQTLDSLVWNPFKLDTVSKNINKTINVLTKQHAPQMKVHLKASYNFSTSFVADYEKSISFSDIELISLNQTPTEKMKIPKVRHSLQSIPKIASVMNSLGLNDSVANFMRLRQKTDTKIKIPNQQPSLNIVVSDNVTKKPIIHEVECEIDEFSMKFLNRIFEYCKPDISTLVSKNIIKDQNLFLYIEASYLDFILKENIKCNDKAACEILLHLIPMKKAITIATQLDTEASLDYLKLLNVKDTRFPLFLRDLSEIQFEIIYSGHSTSKIMKLCNILKEQTNNISLILISNARSHKTVLMETITRISGIPIAPALTFPDYKCYIFNSEDINAAFLWDRFSTVIEFNQSTKYIEDMIADSKMHHYILNTVLPPQNGLICTNNDELKIVAYSSLDFKVLQSLETEYNFVVYQRQALSDFSHETLIIDEKTCVLIIRNLNEIKQVRDMSTLFITVSLSYSLMNIIFDVSTCHYTELFSVVFASTAHFSTNDLKINYYYCLSLDDICKTVARISQDVKVNIGVQWKSTELWLKRTWLTEEESNHEKILSKIPCINAYVAQIMLTTYPIIDLMSLNLQELIQNISVVPENVLKEFYRSVHHSVQTDHNKTVQFDIVPSIKEYTPTQITDSPRDNSVLYQRTSLPPLSTSFDLGEAVSQSYKTPKKVSGNKYDCVIKTPMKPKNIVKPFVSRNNDKAKDKRTIVELHKNSFSFSKRRKVLIDKEKTDNGGQTTLFIGK